MDKQPRLVTVPITCDPDREVAVMEARAALDRRSKELLETYTRRVDVRHTLDGGDRQDVAHTLYEEDTAELEVLRQALTAAEAALAETVTRYTFRPLGWKAWRALKAKHPSKKKDFEFDVDSLAPELLRHASHEPRLTAERVDALLEDDTYSEAEIMMLINAAYQAQT